MSGLGEFGALKWQALHGSIARRLVIRAFLFAMAISMLPLIRLLCDEPGPTKLYTVNPDVCASDLGFFMDPNSNLGRLLKPFTPIAFPHVRYYAQCRENENLTLAVARELMGMHLLSHDVRALCVGVGSLSAVALLREMGFSNVRGLGLANVNRVHRNSIFALKQKQVVYELDYGDNSFDFVLARDLDKVSVPALLVDEVERILKPGGLGAVLMDEESSSRESLIRSATHVSSFLRSSTVIHVTSLMRFTLVAFTKKFGGINSFQQYHLPANCPSIARNGPLIRQMEPLVDEKPVLERDKSFTFLPDFINMTSDRRLVYVYMGAREALNFSSNNWFLPSYPIDSRSFDVNVVDHSSLVLSSHVNKPGVTFVYHPGLSNVDTETNPAINQDLEIPVDDEDDFDFLVWFKDTVEVADFVVLKMNVDEAELKFLFQLFESGAICSVDELFLQCSDSDLKNAGAYTQGSCMELFKGLRSSGVFVHQWRETEDSL